MKRNKASKCRINSTTEPTIANKQQDFHLTRLTVFRAQVIKSNWIHKIKSKKKQKVQLLKTSKVQFYKHFVLDFSDFLLFVIEKSFTCQMFLLYTYKATKIVSKTDKHLKLCDVLRACIRFEKRPNNLQTLKLILVFMWYALKTPGTAQVIPCHTIMTEATKKKK